MDNKVLFAVMCILFNQIGVPCFLQGATKTGIIRIVLCIIPFAGQIIAVVHGVMGIILGIKVLQMSDEEYAAAKGTLDMGFPKMSK